MATDAEVKQFIESAEPGMFVISCNKWDNNFDSFSYIHAKHYSIYRLWGKPEIKGFEVVVPVINYGFVRCRLYLRPDDPLAIFAAFNNKEEAKLYMIANGFDEITIDGDLWST